MLRASTFAMPRHLLAAGLLVAFIAPVEAFTSGGGPAHSRSHAHISFAEGRADGGGNLSGDAPSEDKSTSAGTITATRVMLVLADTYTTTLNRQRSSQQFRRLRNSANYDHLRFAHHCYFCPLRCNTVLPYSHQLTSILVRYRIPEQRPCYYVEYFAICLAGGPGGDYVDWFD